MNACCSFLVWYECVKLFRFVKCRCFNISHVTVTWWWFRTLIVMWTVLIMSIVSYPKGFMLVAKALNDINIKPLRISKLTFRYRTRLYFVQKCCKGYRTSHTFHQHLDCEGHRTDKICSRMGTTQQTSNNISKRRKTRSKIEP